MVKLGINMTTLSIFTCQASYKSMDEKNVKKWDHRLFTILPKSLILYVIVMEIFMKVPRFLVNSSLAFCLVTLLVSCASAKVQKDVMVSMHDGIKLSTHILLPKAQGKFPVILIRTPYSEGPEVKEWGEQYANYGYALVIQEVRGTGRSQGNWNPGVYEKSDGITTRKWILDQPWCDGNIGTTGGSYRGFTQMASSVESTEGLKAMIPSVALMDVYEGGAYINGALRLGSSIGWGLGMASPSVDDEGIEDDDHEEEEESDEEYDEDEGEDEGGWDFRVLPLTDIDKKNVGKTLPWMQEWIKNPTFNDHWKQVDTMKVLKEKCQIPLISISGWYDIFVDQALRYQADAINQGKKNQHLIIGPWAHGANEVPGERKMGRNQELPLDEMELYWFEYWLKGKGDGVDLPPIKLYTMGKNQWRDVDQWPLKNTKYANYYFHSEGKANTLKGDGVLSLEKPQDQPANHYVYDPENPVPTHGGPLLFGDPGAHDQRKIQAREDVLVFTSDALAKELDVTGPIKVVLYASTDAKDTDWTAKLIDVYPDGRAFNLCDGIIRARYHKDPLNPELLKPNQVYKYEIDLWATSNVFLKGHKIRVEISSSNFPRFDRNPNTGNKFGMDSKLQKANQTIYHNKEYPSHITLPVIDN